VNSGKFFLFLPLFISHLGFVGGSVGVLAVPLSLEGKPRLAGLADVEVVNGWFHKTLKISVPITFYFSAEFTLPFAHVHSTS